MSTSAIPLPLSLPLPTSNDLARGSSQSSHRSQASYTTAHSQNPRTQDNTRSIHNAPKAHHTFAHSSSSSHPNGTFVDTSVMADYAAGSSAGGDDVSIGSRHASSDFSGSVSNFGGDSAGGGGRGRRWTNRVTNRYSVTAMYSLAAEQDTDLTDSLAQAQRRLRDLKGRISGQSKKNFVLERDVRYLDSRIALLIQNRMADEEQREVKETLENDADSPSGEGRERGLDDRKTSQYANLFFLLQSEPRHVASLCRLVSLGEIDTLLQTVMFTLYGNQYESREEHLLLTMFQVSPVFFLLLRCLMLPLSPTPTTHIADRSPSLAVICFYPPSLSFPAISFNISSAAGPPSPSCRPSSKQLPSLAPCFEPTHPFLA